MPITKVQFTIVPVQLESISQGGKHGGHGFYEFQKVIDGSLYSFVWGLLGRDDIWTREVISIRPVDSHGRFRFDFSWEKKFTNIQSSTKMESDGS